MAKFNFPRNPGTDRENPFEDTRGDNPFSDGEPPPSEAIATNAFATPAEDAQRPHTPGGYEAILVSSGNRPLLLGIIGVVLSGFGILGAGIGIMGSPLWITPFFMTLSLQFAALAAALPACIIASRDLRAIKAGAMRDEGRRRLRWAFWLGVVGAAMGTVPVAIYFVLLGAHFING